ncbi:MAG: hypothetical protein H6721_23720 [Sandaracinus sp.]|nr:hypothetical protein [Sandaracinus sp.]
MLGTSIPLAWRIAGGSPEEAARHSGRVLATNTLGGLGGSLVAGFVLVPFSASRPHSHGRMPAHARERHRLRSVARGLVPQIGDR